MATENITEKNIIKSWFKRGLKPLEAQFHAWMDSYWHKSEKIPTSSVENLETVLNNKAEEANVTELGKKISEIETAYKAEDTKLENTIRQEAARAMTTEDGKVDKEDGKGLSANDYTDLEKAVVGRMGVYCYDIKIIAAPDDPNLGISAAYTDPVTGETYVDTKNISLVDDTHNGLMPPLYHSIVKSLTDLYGNHLNIDGTPSFVWRIGPTGPKVKNSEGLFELRNNTDTDYTGLTVGDLTIKGNVVQEGGSFITNAETVETKDNLILLNKGEVGAGVTKGIAGLEIDRGTQENYKIIFDESDDRFKAGTENDLWPIMLRDNEANLTGGALLAWNAGTKRAKTRSEGSGSGLDADLLDGRQGSDYALKTDLTAISWDYVTGKPVTATRWPSWDEVTNKPAIPAIPSLSEVEGSGVGYLITGVNGYTISRRGIVDGDIPASIARMNQIPSLAGYATQGWVQGQGYITLAQVPAMDKASIVAKLNEPGEVTMSQHWVFAGGVANTSDMRYKRNIEPIDPVLAKIAAMTVFKYNWEDEVGFWGKRRIGISAQELEERFPEATDEMGDDRKTKTVDLQSQIAILFAAVKELNIELEEMKRENEGLKNRLKYE